MNQSPYPSSRHLICPISWKACLKLCYEECDDDDILDPAAPLLESPQVVILFELEPF